MKKFPIHLLGGATHPKGVRNRYLRWGLQKFDADEVSGCLYCVSHQIQFTSLIWGPPPYSIEGDNKVSLKASKVVC